MQDLKRAFYGLWIDGQEVAADDGKRASLINPATGQVWAEGAVASAAQVDQAVAAAHSALIGPWRKLTPQQRSRVLFRYAEVIDLHRDQIAEVESLGAGKVRTDAAAEVSQVVDDLTFYAGLSDKIGGSTIPVGTRAVAATYREPVGVCAQIVPWNYPFMMAGWKVAPALAAGCTVVLKPASLTPATAVLLGQLAKEAGIPDGVVNVVCGPGESVGSALITHPKVNKVTFTGATETGKDVMTKAALGLKRVSLELGGKSPSIVFADADLEAAAAGSVFGIFYSAGQSCDARSRLLIESSVYEEFLALFVAKAKSLRLGDPLAPTTQMGPLISASHRQKVHAHVQAGIAEGGRLLTGGSLPADGLAEGGFFYPATVLADVGEQMAVFQEEIFGPVVVACAFADEAEAIRLANAVDYGLVATIWSENGGRAQRVAQALQCGLIGINTPFTAGPGLPFGGYKASGFGRELGQSAIELYTEEKCVITRTTERPINPFRV
ncbi:MAG: aldehyde dehydrogenase family protein [Sulfobacillus sp.]